MKRKQRERHEWKMYLKTLRYGARYDVITTPAVREWIYSLFATVRQKVGKKEGGRVNEMLL